MKVIKTNWLAAAGITCCTIIDRGRKFNGVARCCKEDKDFMNEYTGMRIAQQRACIAAQKDYIQNDIKPRLKAIKQLYYSINRSKYYNEKCYENRMIRRQLCMIKNELTTAQMELIQLEQTLKDYIEEKDKFYKKVRKIRSGKKD